LLTGFEPVKRCVRIATLKARRDTPAGVQVSDEKSPAFPRGTLSTCPDTDVDQAPAPSFEPMMCFLIVPMHWRTRPAGEDWSTHHSTISRRCLAVLRGFGRAVPRAVPPDLNLALQLDGLSLVFASQTLSCHAARGTVLKE